jgi:hypothetical protein
MEVMYSPDTWHLDKYVLGVRAETAFIETCKEQRRNYMRVTGQYGLDDQAEKDYEESLKLGTGMIRWYAKEHLPQGEYTPIAVEIKFQVPILDEEGFPQFCWCDRCHDKWLHANSLHELPTESWIGLPVMYEGRIDGLMQDKRGDYWILDWKTTARMMSEDSDIILETDDQIASYCWALMRSMGLNIRGFLYVELRKGSPKPPVELKQMRLGRQFSVSKQQDTEYGIFQQTVMSQDADAYQRGLYDEHLEWLKNEGVKYIQVHKIYKPRQTLDNIGKYIYYQAKEMINAPAIYPSPGRFVCAWCAFQGPCIDATAGRDYQYALDTLYEIKPRYYEEAKPSTDKKP